MRHRRWRCGRVGVERRRLSARDRADADCAWWSLGAVSLVGGLLGAMLLVRTSDTSFMRLLPWLMLAAAVTFTFGAPRGRDGQRRTSRDTIGRQRHREIRTMKMPQRHRGTEIK